RVHPENFSQALLYKRLVEALPAFAAKLNSRASLFVLSDRVVDRDGDRTYSLDEQIFKDASRSVEYADEVGVRLNLRTMHVMRAIKESGVGSATFSPILENP